MVLRIVVSFLVAGACVRIAGAADAGFVPFGGVGLVWLQWNGMDS